MIGYVDSLIDEVNDFYKEITSVILSALEKSRVSQKLKIKGDIYNNIAKDSNDLDDKLAAFINEQHKKSKENTQIVN